MNSINIVVNSILSDTKLNFMLNMYSKVFEDKTVS